MGRYDSDWDWEYDDFYYYENKRGRVNDKFIEKYIKGFDLVKDELINTAKETIKKWNFSAKINEEMVQNSLESFKNNLSSSWRYIGTDEDVIEYLNEVITAFCNNKDSEIKDSLLNL